jgi:hypothetical protein
MISFFGVLAVAVLVSSSTSANAEIVVGVAASACVYVQGASESDSVIVLEFTPETGEGGIALEVAIAEGETAEEITGHIEQALENAVPGYILCRGDEVVCITRWCRVPKFSLKVTNAEKTPALCIEAHEIRGCRPASSCERFLQAPRERLTRDSHRGTERGFVQDPSL